MKQREIRCPKFCAVIFLLTGLGEFLSIATQLLDHFLLHQTPIELLEIAEKVVSGTAFLFISGVLFKKHYDKLLVCAMAGLAVRTLFDVVAVDFLYVNVFSVMVDMLLLFVTVSLVCGSEKVKLFVTKTRFAVPVLNIVSIVIQTVFTFMEIKQMEYDADVARAAVVIIMSCSVPSAVLSVMNYFKLVAWLVDPYEEIKETKKKRGVRA